MKGVKHPVEVTLRASISAVMALTGETLTSLGEAVGLSVVIVSRRQRGITPWSVAELGVLGEHWDIPPCALISSPIDALAELPADRVAELRRAHGLAPYPAMPTAAPAAA